MFKLDMYEVGQKLKEMSEIASAAKGIPRTWGNLKEQYYELIWIKWNRVCAELFKIDSKDPNVDILNEKEQMYSAILDNLRKNKSLCIWAKVNLSPLDS